MSKLNILKNAKTLSDLAHLLNYKPKYLSYIIYKKQNLYHQFTIPKSSGAPRTILAPCDELKALQKKVSELLQDCLENMNQDLQIHSSLSHGFMRGHSIMTNADNHRKKRFVFNIDIQDFFGSIHLGRVRGFFINNKSFQLDPKVATVLAQIACYNNSLPQGSPCSPVVSNLIGHLIDIRLVSIAKKAGCQYSRYADDITFSTNKTSFPSTIAIQDETTGNWSVSEQLAKIIKKCGFSLNTTKTRMTYRKSQQTVTGLVVNQKVHTSASYRKQARAMAHKLFNDGSFSIPDKASLAAKENSPKMIAGTLNQLEGIFSHIYMVDQFNRNKLRGNNGIRGEDLELTAIEKTHRDFLFFKHFYSTSLPTIICEGKTDNVYIQCAIRSLATQYPELATIDAQGKRILKVRFINYSELTHRVLDLNGGTADIARLICGYVHLCGKYHNTAPKHPTIVLIDNDQGSQSIFSAIKSTTKDTHTAGTGKNKQIDRSKNFYYIAQNLYVVATPLINGKDSMMEDFFKNATLATLVDKKTFSVRTPTAPTGSTYGKHIFAQKVVKANRDKIDFSDFSPILDSLKSVIQHFKLP
ncbi:retron Ec67 family RNA-directed DNA polymerase/endonuclease [Stutzerimonas kirkiae]|uniref:retron Ec67 family RNA-directed DNA polymerase/endonuclease n=1 Tax=Stutzerimonas kirkiae TaxID=2211392 RepID=UPI001038579D|nr:retron Ec67 family RNA-directed DNA polymerase/endonuclease [Stutzerimonas kirkiae]TBV11349.1 RNA-directed DNA polymerase [Stutzerimonas kirkiae]